MLNQVVGVDLDSGVDVRRLKAVIAPAQDEGRGGLPVVIGQGRACTTILSAAEMQLHCALKNAQPGGEMTGFMRLGEQDIFSPIKVSRGRAHPPMIAGHGIEVDKEKLQRLVRPPSA